MPIKRESLHGIYTSFVFLKLASPCLFLNAYMRVTLLKLGDTVWVMTICDDIDDLTKSINS